MKYLFREFPRWIVVHEFHFHINNIYLRMEHVFGCDTKSEISMLSEVVRKDSVLWCLCRHREKSLPDKRLRLGRLWQTETAAITPRSNENLFTIPGIVIIFLQRRITEHSCHYKTVKTNCRVICLLSLNGHVPNQRRPTTANTCRQRWTSSLQWQMHNATCCQPCSFLHPSNCNSKKCLF